MEVSVPPKQIPNYVALNEKGDVTDCIVMAKKKNLLFILQINRKKTDKAGCGNFK